MSDFKTVKLPEAQAQGLARRLAQAVDRRLKDPRDERSPPTDGQLAVAVVLTELERELKAMGLAIAAIARPVNVLHELSALRAYLEWAERGGVRPQEERDRLLDDIERARAVDLLAAMAAPFGIEVRSVRATYVELHEALDRLLGAFFAANRRARTSSTIHELMTWSHAQAFAPPEGDAPPREPDAS
jgi:hypothetical protein